MKWARFSPGRSVGTCSVYVRGARNAVFGSAGGVAPRLGGDCIYCTVGGAKRREQFVRYQVRFGCPRELPKTTLVLDVPSSLVFLAVLWWLLVWSRYSVVVLCLCCCACLPLPVAIYCVFCCLQPGTNILLCVAYCCSQGAIKFMNGEYLMPCASDLPQLTFTIGGKVGCRSLVRRTSRLEVECIKQLLRIHSFVSSFWVI